MRSFFYTKIFSVFYYARIVYFCIFTFPGLKTLNQPLSTITKKPCISSK